MTCCQESPFVVITKGDVRRITEATGRNDFFAIKQYDDLSFMDTYKYDPNWHKYVVMPGNRFRVLQLENEGPCVFLHEDGCELPWEIRPLMCRIYPYNYNEFGIIGFYAHEDLWCPVPLLKKGETLSGTLNMTREQADRWRIMYYEELRADYEEREKNNRPALQLL